MTIRSTYAGIRVLELAENIAGPLAGLVLADLGADVIKIERPSGEATRALPPRWDGESTVFLTYNRNKRSVALDLSSPAGRETVLQLTRTSDVVIESFRPGAAERLGLGHDDLVAVRPDLVHLSISAFGEGPLGSARAGYDALVQAFSGIMAMTGHPDSGPARCAPSVLDVSAGMWGAMSVMAALARRAQDPGLGAQRVEATLLDAALFLQGHQVTGYLATGQHPGRLGAAAPSAAPYDVYETANEPLLIATSTDNLFRRLCGVLGLPHLADDQRYRSLEDRVTHRAELDLELAGVLRTRSREEWLSALLEAGVPAGPVHELATALRDPLVAERGLLAPALPGRIDGLVQIHLPLDRLREAPLRQPPALGEHTDELLAELGLLPITAPDPHQDGAIAAPVLLPEGAQRP